MKAYDAIEECPGNGSSGVRVSQRNEMRILRKPVDHGEDDTLAVHPGKALDKIHGDIRPNL
jgi:hypothetical protein